jgi:hypothetical protein
MQIARGHNNPSTLLSLIPYRQSIQAIWKGKKKSLAVAENVNEFQDQPSVWEARKFLCFSL